MGIIEHQLWSKAVQSYWRMNSKSIDMNNEGADDATFYQIEIVKWEAIFLPWISN